MKAISSRLNGSGSSDANGNDLRTGGRSSRVRREATRQLNSATVVNPTFTADLAGIYTLQLIVNDTIVDSPADTVVVTAAVEPRQLALVNTQLVGVGTQAGVRVLLPFDAPAGGVTVSLSQQRSARGNGVALERDDCRWRESGRVKVNGLAVGTTT